MPYTPDNPVVWSELPVTDMTAAMKFYSSVFDYEMTLDESGPNPMSILPAKGGPDGGVAGHLYPGTPAAPGAGPTIHLAVPGKLEDAMERCRKAGGTVRSDPIPLPMGRFAYATDPDGNSIGLFEAPAA
jgi:predicted enzyme related to lactoylglutathione lyase